MGLYRRKVRRRDGTVHESRCWWGSYFDHTSGKTEYQSTKCVDKKAASIVLHGWERRAADPEVRAKDSVPFRVARATFLAAKQRLVDAARRSSSTWDMHEQKSANLADILGDETLVRELTARVIDGYVARRHDEGAHANTIAKELSTLRGILKLAHRHGFCDHPSAIMPLDFGADYKPKERHLGSELELDVLVEQLEEGRAAHVIFIVATGARDGEAKAAQPDDLDLDGGFVKLRGTKTKGSFRMVPIVSFLRPLLERVVREAPGKRVLFRPWSNIRRDLHDACRRACILPLSPNDLRRTFSQWLRKRGVEPALIGAAMGHVDSRMVERVYGRMPAEVLAGLLRQRLDLVPSDASDLVACEGSEGVVGLDLLGEVVPRGGIEPSTRGFSSQRRSHGNVRAFRSKSAFVRRGDAAMQAAAEPPSRFGEVIDDALALGAEWMHVPRRTAGGAA
jgi:integrase